jgi:hypothetical protein
MHVELQIEFLYFLANVVDYRRCYFVIAWKIGWVLAYTLDVTTASVGVSMSAHHPTSIN